MKREDARVDMSVVWHRPFKARDGYERRDIRATIRKCDGGLAAVAVREGNGWRVLHAKFQDLEPEVTT